MLIMWENSECNLF